MTVVKPLPLGMGSVKIMNFQIFAGVLLLCSLDDFAKTIFTEERL